MGKKSKRKSNKPPLCYHGCTKKEFNSGIHYKILDSWDNQVNVDEKIWAATTKSFYEQNKRVVSHPTFDRFVIARIIDGYLKGKHNNLLYRRLLLLLKIRYLYIPNDEGKDVESLESEYGRIYRKYCRDIRTERGRINCMVRESPCDCMEEKKVEAQQMEKVASCYCCQEEFSKKKMMRCLGCDHAQYCSKECSKKDWATHKKECRSIGTSSAPIPTPFSSSSIGEPSDVDVNAEEE